ncbi:ABC transporter ATP-binding protein [Dactylosporangium sp. NPDC000555]|uniref:ABC transporter ATP-binding protein n=1 Tax=Dactylosporangium sp. NPDC000555 TaxID=3154260 RepID=UPI00332728F5
MRRSDPTRVPTQAPHPGALRALPAALALYARAAPAAAAVRLLVAVVTGGAPVAMAWLTKVLLDRLTGQPGPSVWLSALALAGTGAAVSLAVHAGQYADREIGRRVMLFTQTELFTAASRPDGIAELEDPAHQDRLQLAQIAGQSGPQQLAGSVLGIGQAALTIGGFLAALLAVSPLAGVLVLASAVPTLWAQLRIGRQRTELMTRITPNTRRQIFYANLLLDVRAAKEIRLFGLGDFLRGRMLAELGTAQAGERAVDRRALRVDASLALLTAVVSGVALVVTAVRIGHGAGGVGDLAVLVAALAAVQGALAGIVTQVAMANQVLVLFGHYADVVRPDTARQDRPGLPVPPLREGIELRDVWFRYHPDHDWVLRGVNLTIRPAQSVALVGLNGAGKSTLIKLLCRLYEPTRGAITWDGRDVRDLDITELRARIGAVFQDYMSYDLSAADNIAVGDLTADQERLHTAADAAGIGSTLAALPQGYQTMLSRMFAGDSPEEQGPGASGVVLSGGQWQRVAIARAMLRTEADLLILDEPSAGLDAVAEDGIQRSLRRLRAGRSSLLISHRLGSLRYADHIVVLDGGEIVEEGTHEVLMDLDGRYAELFRMQADGYQLGVPAESSRHG